MCLLAADAGQRKIEAGRCSNFIDGKVSLTEMFYQKRLCTDEPFGHSWKGWR